MTFQARLKKCMRQRDWRVADLARHLGLPYMTVREWVLFGRQPSGPERDRQKLEKQVQALEKSS